MIRCILYSILYSLNALFLVSCYAKTLNQFWQRLPAGVLHHLPLLHADGAQQAGGDQTAKKGFQGWNKKTVLLFLLIVNAKDVPIVIAGNKVDLADEGREIFVEDVKDWVDQQYRQNR